MGALTFLPASSYSAQSPYFKFSMSPGIDSKASILQAYVAWAGIFERVWGAGIDFKEWIPPAYVAWRAGTITLFLLGA